MYESESRNDRWRQLHCCGHKQCVNGGLHNHDVIVHFWHGCDDWPYMALFALRCMALKLVLTLFVMFSTSFKIWTFFHCLNVDTWHWISRIPHMRHSHIVHVLKRFALFTCWYMALNLNVPTHTTFMHCASIEHFWHCLHVDAWIVHGPNNTSMEDYTTKMWLCIFGTVAMTLHCSISMHSMFTLLVFFGIPFSAYLVHMLNVPASPACQYMPLNLNVPTHTRSCIVHVGHCCHYLHVDSLH